MKRCNYCGALNNDKAAFCTQCGSPFPVDIKKTDRGNNYTRKEESRGKNYRRKEEGRGSNYIWKEEGRGNTDTGKEEGRANNYIWKDENTEYNNAGEEEEIKLYGSYEQHNKQDYYEQSTYPDDQGSLDQVDDFGYYGYENEEDKDNNRLFNKILVAALVVLIAAALGVGAFMLIRNLGSHGGQSEGSGDTALAGNEKEAGEDMEDEGTTEEEITEEEEDRTQADRTETTTESTREATTEAEEELPWTTTEPSSEYEWPTTEAGQNTEVGPGTESKPDTEGLDSSYEGFLFQDSHQRYLDDWEVEELSKTEVQQAINEIYARKNYRFKKQENIEFFSRYSWYSPMYSDEDDLDFNDYENANLALLSKYRNK